MSPTDDANNSKQKQGCDQILLTLVATDRLCNIIGLEGTTTHLANLRHKKIDFDGQASQQAAPNVKQPNVNKTSFDVQISGIALFYYVT